MGRVRLGRRRDRPAEGGPQEQQGQRWRRLTAVARALGRLRLSPAHRARLGLLTGSAMVASGAGLAAGLAAGIATGGAALIAYCLLLMDVTPPDDDARETSEEQSPW